MNVLIETSPQVAGKRGIGYYTENLMSSLAKLDKKNRYTVFSWFYRDHEAKSAMIQVPEQQNFSKDFRRFPESLMNLLEWKAKLPLIQGMIRRHGPRIYHSTGPRLPHLKKIKTVVTIHDLIYEVFPAWADKRFLAENRRAAMEADMIIADSASTRADIVSHYRIPESKIAVIPLGVDRRQFRLIEDPARLAATKAKLNIPDKFILEVGPFDQRRNTVNLIAAYDMLRKNLPYYKLVLVGHKNPAVEKIVKDAGMERDVCFTGYVTQDELADLFSTAVVFVHPSLYEGFGLSVLEAMSCACPVVTSNTTSLPEVVGDAGLLVNPLSPRSIELAILKVLADKSFREDMRTRGVMRAIEFSWDVTARKTIKVYESLA